MASNTAVTQVRRRIRTKNAGTARKKKMAKKSTLSYTELFAAIDQASSTTNR